MRIIRRPRKKKLIGCVVALGTFDGVHRGHQQVIKKAIREAKKIKAASLAITFDPHPQQLIAPERGLHLLTTLDEREELLANFGIDGVVVIPFNKRVQKLNYEQFVKKYLVDKLGIAKVVVGYDYAFGKGRKGGLGDLRALGKKYGFKVIVVPPVHRGALTIKSGLIRKLLSFGQFKEAKKLLGHHYQISGKVVRGFGRGKTLGFPTANLKVDQHKLIPAAGVYAGRVGKKKAAIYIGSSPTFGLGQTVVEVYLLNFRGNIRGKNLQVNLDKRLRSDKQFADVEQLKVQIVKDINKI